MRRFHAHQNYTQDPDLLKSESKGRGPDLLPNLHIFDLINYKPCLPAYPVHDSFQGLGLLMVAIIEQQLQTNPFMVSQPQQNSGVVDTAQLLNSQLKQICPKTLPQSGRFPFLGGSGTSCAGGFPWLPY